MPAYVALTICVLCILYLYASDINSKPNVSSALWIPLLWMLIIGSRPVSVWLGIGVEMGSIEDYAEGSPLDRNIFSVLIASGLLVLFRRNILWSQFIRLNTWIFMFVLYCGVSILWSDVPFVAAKRWIKGIGNLVMVLIVLTDRDPVEALKTLIRRWTYVLIPLSVVLIKYFPEQGRSYDRWTGEARFSGVGSDKNALGYLCLISGLFLAWSLLKVWRVKELSGRKNETVFMALAFVMVCWLLYKANSATSLLVFMFGIVCLVLLGVSSVRKNLTLYVFVGGLTVAVLLSLVDVVGMGLDALNRDVTLTGRTELWKDLVSAGTDPLIGVGYESFWLGEEAKRLWKVYWWHPNQAHNGYLDMYLNLGAIGVLLLIGIIVAVYRHVKRSLASMFDEGSLRLTFLGAILLYALTEAAFKGLHPMWFVFLLLSMERPRSAEVVGSKQKNSTQGFPI